MTECKFPSLLSENFIQPTCIGGYYEAIEYGLEELRGSTGKTRLLLKKKVTELMRACNKLAGRPVYISSLK